jgi:hypothetical protein
MLIVGLVAAWRMKVTHYQFQEWRLRVRQVKQTRSVFFNELPWAGLAVAGVILAVRVLF